MTRVLVPSAAVRRRKVSYYHAQTAEAAGLGGIGAARQSAAYLDGQTLHGDAYSVYIGALARLGAYCALYGCSAIAPTVRRRMRDAWRESLRLRPEVAR